MAAKFSGYLKNIFFILLLLQFAPLIIQNFKKHYSRFFKLTSQVGYLPIKGIIMSSNYYNHFLKKMFEDKEIKAILVFIESPGGAAGSAEAIAREIDILKKEHPKPIITLTENILASGGYYIASSTDYIIAPPSALVGSIGTTIPGQFKVRDFLESHNIHYNVVKAGEYKAVTDPFVNTTPEQNAFLQQLVESSYHNFSDYVIKHRPKLNWESVNQWADGKIFTGVQAQTLGLIDLIGSKTDAIKKIKELAIIEGEIEWIKPDKRSSFMSLFSSDDYVDDHESLINKMVTSICMALEERYGLLHGLKN